MSIPRKLSVLPLAAIIAFGMTGCGSSGDISNNSGTIVSQDKSSNQNAELRNAGVNTGETLTNVFALSSTAEFQAVNASLSEKEITSVADLTSILDRHKDTVRKALDLVEFDKQNRADYMQILLASENSSGVLTELAKDENETTLEQIMALGVISTVGSGYENTTLNVIGSGISRTDAGKIQISEQSVYFVDAHGGIKNFLSTGVDNLYFSSDGRKLSIQTVAAQFKDSPTEKESDDSIVSDVRDAATAVESYIVTNYSDGKELPLDGKEKEIFKSLKLSSTSNILLVGSNEGYKITGKNKETGKTAIYDSIAGGMQEDTGQKAADDYSIFSNYKQKATYGSTIDEVVSMLNSEAVEGEKYEVVEKSGVKYVKVQHPASQLARNGDLLYAFDSVEQ